MSTEEIFCELQKIQKQIEEQNILKKEVLTLVEASKYLELSESHLYRMTSRCEIPHYKPNGKKIYFNREELDRWLLRGRVMSKDEIDEKVDNYLINKKKNR